MNTTACDSAAVRQLNKIAGATLPGNRFALIATAALALFVMVSCCASSILVPNGNKSSRIPSTTKVPAAGSNQQQNKTDPSPFFSMIMCALVIIVPIACVGIVLFRSKLNTDFIKANSVHLDYHTDTNAFRRHARMSKVIEELYDEGDLLEIAKIDGDYRHCGAGRFKFSLPKYVTCNAEVYYLQVKADICYFLPDCILFQTDGKYYRISPHKAQLNTKRIFGSFYIQRYRSAMVHGRIRKDGGYDERYNTRFGKVAYDSFESLEPYGIIRLDLGGAPVVLLTTREELAEDFGVALCKWNSQ